MASIYDMIMEHSHEIGFLNADRIMPYLICSTGCHIANLRNQLAPKAFTGKPNKESWEFHHRQGQPSQLRLNLLFVAPSGWSKSFSMNQFLHPQFGLLQDTYFQTDMENKMTDAYLIGGNTYTDKNGDIQYREGLAERKSISIIGIDEFASLTGGKWSEEIVDSLLSILSDGYVTKGVGGTEIKYKTNITMWAGTQNVRLNLGAGLDRRFFVIGFAPSKQDEEDYFYSAFENEGKKPNYVLIKKIRKSLKILYKTFKLSKLPEITPRYDHFRKSFVNKMTHREVFLFENLALGYTIMNTYKAGDRDVIIDLTPELKRIYELGLQMRHIYLYSAEAVQVARYLGDRVMTLAELKHEIMYKLQFEREAIDKVLKQMRQDKQIIVKKQTIAKGKKSKDIRLRQEVMLSPDFKHWI